MENIMTSKPFYERIVFDRDSKTVEGFTFEKDDQRVYSEHYIYHQDDTNANNTVYDMFLHKNPGF